MRQKINKKNITISDAVRESVRQAAEGDFTSKIADRLESIERRLSATASQEDVEKIFKQLLVMAEANNMNANALALGIRKITERST